VSHGNYTKKVVIGGKVWYEFQTKPKPSAAAPQRNSLQSNVAKKNFGRTENITNPGPDDFLNHLSASITHNCWKYRMLSYDMSIMSAASFCGKSLLEVYLVVLCLLYFVNFAWFHLKKVLLFVKWLLPDYVSGIFNASSNFLNSTILGFYCLMNAQKTQLSNGTILLFDFQQKIQEKFNSRSFREALLNGKLRIRKDMQNQKYKNVMEDINDGAYMVHLNKTILRKSQNLALQIFLDGVSPFKGASESLVPVYLVNLQISLAERFDLKNMILIALLDTKEKENYSLFLQKVSEKLAEELKAFKIQFNGKRFSCKALVINAVMDLKEEEKVVCQSSGLSFVPIQYS